MKLYDAGKILAGLFVFLCVATSPVWYNLAAGRAAYRPQPRLPQGQRECVAPREVMVATHMTLLSDWRNRAIRAGDRGTVTAGGRPFAISLSQGCMQCHADKAAFCDACHNYVGASPACWNCHVEPLAKR